MGKCIFCGQEAGFLKTKHEACEARHSQGLEKVRALAESAIRERSLLATLQAETRSAAAGGFVSEEERIDLVSRAYGQAVDDALKDGLLSADEEQGLSQIGDGLSLSREQLDRHGGYTRLVQGGLIRDLTEGKIPMRMNIKGELPFLLQKNEMTVWLFDDVRYHEVRTRTRYVGGSQGVSVRLARGVYYRLGGFAAEPIKSEETVYVGTGPMLVTSKNVYFGSSLKSVRIPYNKIVSITPYSDGVGIQRDAVSAKPQLFINGAGWFTYNLLMNLSRRP